MPNNIAKLTNKSLDPVNFSTDEIAKVINNFYPNKAHGNDMLIILMIKLCGNSVCKPLSILFNDCLKEGKFPSGWKKAHVSPVHKKGDKKCLKVIDLFPYFQFAAKFLCILFIINYLSLLLFC